MMPTKSTQCFQLILIIILGCSLFSCKQQQSLQSRIDLAIKNKDSVLVIPDGKYVIDQPLQLSGVDNLVIKAESPNGVTITSSMDLPIENLTCLDKAIGLYEYTDPKLIMPPWPDSFKGYAGWPEIYIAGVPLSVSRYPNEGFIQADSIIRDGKKPENKETKQEPPKFLSAQLTQNYNKELPLFLNGYWTFKWADEIIRVDSINPQSGEIELAAPHNYGMGAPSGGLFYAINQPEYVDTENEYYYNPNTGTIRFIHSFSEEEVGSIQITYQDFTLLEIRDCNQIKIENINFKYHNNLAVSISNSKSVVIEQAEMYGLGRSAVAITEGFNCGVRNSTLKYLGDAGILLSGGDKNTLTKASHFVEDCSISYFSRHVKTYAPAVKLTGVGHIVRGNHISFAPHNAILFSGNDHLIAENVIRKVCLNTSDAGAIYCGRDWTMGGTVIRENTISELGQASHHNNWAIYLDDLASGISVVNNHIEDSPSGVLVGGGRYNQISNNTIINCPLASIVYDARGYDDWFKHHLVDRELSLWPRLKAVPINQAPWSERFPWLQAIHSDDPAIPRGAEIKNNQIISSAPPQIHEIVYEYGQVANNKENTN
ncbi:right-handed parallel beta-helix repeat-containing protein [Cyclobacterium marinum]|uniref:right-handed parallel beta-helix repeat-containing protein n=1 Tax=Cyclobacterium marinum TaxID=104 RepID=UPI0011EF5ED0|nr:right-handed parallel beta-helix repeat-containing protein [Cyclobacterium marinum]MBI0400421.1 right-handed parallel beta-helix repeat-containing protein [Cyclobacterium marinum]